MIRSYVVRLAILLCACTVSLDVMTMGGAPVGFYDDDSLTYVVPAAIEATIMTMGAVLPHALKHLPFEEALLHVLEMAKAPGTIVISLVLPTVFFSLRAGHDPLKYMYRPPFQWGRPGDQYWLVGSIVTTCAMLLYSRNALLGNRGVGAASA